MSDFKFLLAPLFGWFLAQTIKFVSQLRKDGVTWSDVVQSGGMPSSHAAFMVSLSTIIGINFGISHVYFAVVIALTAIIIYDSVGVRRTVGEHTEAVNELAVKADHNLKTKIHHAKGHTIIEAFVGIIVGIFSGLLLELLL